jgi:hypothetical protein
MAWLPTMRRNGARAARTRADAVTRSTAVRWGLAGGKVLPVSTGGVPGCHRTGGVEAGLTLAAARREGAEQRRRRRGGGRHRGSGGSGERWGGPAAQAEAREVAAVRRRSGEGKIVVQGRKFGRWRRLRFKGERRGGGLEGWAPHGGRAGEREGGPGRGEDSVARATVKGGGVGVTQNGVADRWVGTRRGPVVSGWVQHEAAR